MSRSTNKTLGVILSRVSARSEDFLNTSERLEAAHRAIQAEVRAEQKVVAANGGHPVIVRGLAIESAHRTEYPDDMIWDERKKEERPYTRIRLTACGGKITMNISDDTMHQCWSERTEKALVERTRDKEFKAALAERDAQNNG